MKQITPLFFWCLTLLMPLQLFAQTDPDTLKGDLGEVVVTGYEGNRSLMESPGAITNIEDALINGLDESSLLYGLNSVPGVRLEQRAPGSYRVAIRGSSLRAPFGVRNVKIYWNGIPFTEPSGSTPLNLLDVLNMQQVEVIRGPAGSIYGAGNGGVLLLESKDPSDSEAGSGLSFGSYGMQRYTAYAGTTLPNGELRFNYADQQSDGYREQSFFKRRTAELSGRFQLSDRRIIQTSFLYSDLNYGIPGGLTLAQYRDDPSQARQGNAFVLGSVEANASVDQQAFVAGISQDLQLSDDLSNLTTLYGNFSNFENPFNLDYKKDSRSSGGGRTRFYLDRRLGAIDTRFTLGGEYQAAKYAARNFENNSGEAGALNFDDDITLRSGLIFLNAEFNLPKNWFLTAGLSYNRLEYRIDRLVTNLDGDTPGLAEKTFDPEIIPRIGLLKKVSPALSLHGSLSYGFSPPTIEEFRTNEGSIALDLEAEEGTNYEAGARGSLRQLGLNYDLTAFYFRLEETIVQQPSGRNSTVVFENAGATDQYGAELALNWRLLRQSVGMVEQLQWDLSYTWHDFSFRDYQKDGVDYSGNALTGVAPHTVVSSLKAVSRAGLYATLGYTFTDAIPLNDANTVYSDPYHLLQVKAGYEVSLGEELQLEVFAGIDNLLDERYSLGYDLNAFGDRYYQPAAPRHYFGGLKVVKAL